MITFIKPDGYIEEEKKSEDEGHGFETFFSETGASYS
jgi:hypothetical protein